MRVLLVRHGIAVGYYDAPSDEARWLTPEGRAGVHSVAKRLRELDVAPTRMLMSPLVRAAQTATILAGDGFTGPLEVNSALSPEYGTSAQALAPLDEFDDDDTVVLVGHEPKIRGLAAHLAGSSPLPPFYPGAACMVEWTQGVGRFVFLLDPRTGEALSELPE